MAFLLVIVYIAFISLGVPDSLIGAAWPAIYPDMQMPVEAISGIMEVKTDGANDVRKSKASYKI